MNSDLQIFSQSCPLFVPIIEEGLENHHIAKLISKEYLSPLIQQNIQVLILGCTHYPIMKKTITASLPQGVKIIDSAETLSSYTQKYLNKNKKASRNSNIKTHLFITDGSEHFNQFARNILDDEFCSISNIKLF